jgi:hypothetical protein
VSVLSGRGGRAALRASRARRAVDHRGAEPGDSASDSGLVRRDVEGPSDVMAVFELFHRRYGEVRGEDYPDSVQDRF